MVAVWAPACGSVTDVDPDGSSPGDDGSAEVPDAASGGAEDADVDAGADADAPELVSMFPARTWPSNPAELEAEIVGNDLTSDVIVIWDVGGDEVEIAPTSVDVERLEVALAPSLWAERERGEIPIALERDGQRSQSIEFSLGGVLPGTGQTSCYTADEQLGSCPSSGADFVGQDAQFGWDLHVAPADRYAIDGTPSNPVVVDRLVDLEWQGCVNGLTGSDCSSGEASSSDFSEAVEACEQLSWGGRSDWRLPSRPELASILDLDRALPAVDEAFFPETPFSGGVGDSHWTATAIPGFDNYYWTLFFDGGGTGDDPDDRSRLVRCVRGEGPPASDVRRIEATSGEPVVNDRATGLEWQGCSAGQSGDGCDEGAADELDWENALAFCHALTWGGHDDWRLPDVNELMTLIDFEAFGPSIDEETFPETESARYWTSTTVSSSASSAFQINFSSGSRETGGIKATSSNRHARCVRSGLAP